MQDIAMTISGMSCGHCLNAVQKAIGQVAGIEVRSVRIGRAEVRVPDQAHADRVKAAIESSGYRVEGIVGG